MQLQATRTARIDHVQPDERVLDPESEQVIVVDEVRRTSKQVQLLGFPLGRTGGRRLSIAGKAGEEVVLVPEPTDSQHLAAIILHDLHEYEKRVIKEQEEAHRGEARRTGQTATEVAVSPARITVDKREGSMTIVGPRGVRWTLAIVQDVEPEHEELIDGEIEGGPDAPAADDD